MFGINPYVIIGVILTFLASNVGSFFYGEHIESLAQAKTMLTHEVKQQAKTIKTQAESADVNTKIGAKLDADQQKSQIVYRDVYKEIKIRLPADSDTFVTCGFVRLYDHAASGRADVSSVCAGKSDNAASDVKLSEVIAVSNDNFNNVCNENANELKAWQDWYAEQKTLIEQNIAKKQTVIQRIFN